MVEDELLLGAELLLLTVEELVVVEVEVLLLVADVESAELVEVEVSLSPTFYAWVFRFGGEIRILSPDKAVEEMKGLIRDGSF